MNRVQEMLQAKAVPAGTMFQVKVDKADWKDVPLNGKSIIEIAREVHGMPRNAKQIKTMYQLHDMVLEYHLGPFHRLPQSDVFDVIDEDYDVISTDDDVLKIQYHFTVRYKDRNSDSFVKKARGKNAVITGREPRDVKGVLTLMPGN